MKTLHFWSISICLFILHFSSAGAFAGDKDSVLLLVQDREISKAEFLYHFNKNYQELNQENLDTYLDLFINFHLKLAQAREGGMDQNIGFINELTEYRLQLAAPYLTHEEKELEFIQEASNAMHLKSMPVIF